MNTGVRLNSARWPTRPPRHASAGFTLIEVLIATAITIVAFTGLASLQVLSLRAAESALGRTQATALAYEMADRLRLNRGAPGDPSTALGGAYDNKTLCDDQARACTFDELSDFTGTDAVTAGLRYWWKDAKALGLNGWYAGIKSQDEIFRIAVRWDDTRAEDDASSGGAQYQSCLGDTLEASTQEICVMTQL